MAKDTDSIYPKLNEQLVRHLQDRNQVIVVSKLFAQQETNADRVGLAYDLLEENACFPTFSIDGKSCIQSEEFRRKGNLMFKSRKSKEAHEFYTKSIAFAEEGNDNLALAYANRSMVLFENRLYEECLKDIELALQNNYPENLKPKLLARQLKAKDLLPTQEKVDFFTPTPKISETEQNPLIQSALKSIRIENSETLGRHIVAIRDIEPGEIIAIEDPFCQVLVDDYYTHCHHCLNLSYNLIPCSKCTEALFCSRKCQADANQAYHQYECPISLTLKNMDLSCNSRLLHLRVAILAREHYGTLDQCVLKHDSVYISNRYNEIHNLVANTSSRSVSDLFNRAVNAAAFYHLLKEYTGFFDGKQEDFHVAFKELVLHHMQTGPCNFHEITEVKSCDNSLEQKEIGAGAYSFMSMFNHSCCPNVVRNSYGSTLVAIAIEPIMKGDQCYDNYGYHHAVMPKQARQAKLKKQYYFDCTCIACLNDYPQYDALLKINSTDLMVSIEDLKYLQDYNLEEAKKISTKLIRKIKALNDRKPNKNLAEMQETLKQCHFIFRTIKTPF